MNEFRIGIVGLGYVGLPLCVEFAKKHGFVIGYDINEERVNELLNNYDRTNEISSEELKKIKEKSNTPIYTTNSESLMDCNVIIVTVPTPIDEYKKPDLRPLISATKEINEWIQPKTLVIYESTVFPSCTEDVCIPIFEKSGLKLNEYFWVGYSPERINPGDKVNTLTTIEKVISASNDEALDMVDKLYKSIDIKTHRAPNIKVAEMSKAIENAQRDLNISFANEVALFCDKLDIDTQDVMDAAGTKWNFLSFKAGLVGGHCLDEKEFVTILHNDELKNITIKELYALFIDNNETIKILSYNEQNNKTEYNNIETVTKTNHKRKIEFRFTNGGYLTTSTKHPFLVKEKNGLIQKFAEDIKKEDLIPIITSYPKREFNNEINLIDFIVEKRVELIPKIRVKIKNDKWKNHKFYVSKKYLNTKVSNFIYWDYLPLDKYLLIRDMVSIDEKNIILVSGRGKMSSSQINAIIDFNNDFSRLIGYYLSEGCISEGYKIRITINKQENELLNDIKNIICDLGTSLSIYKDKTYNAQTIKISNRIIGEYFNYLGLGKDSYDAKIPNIIFENSNDNIRINLLKGLFSGDGGVDSKHSKNVNYFTISNKMYQQIILMLHDFKFNPYSEQRLGLFTINSLKDLEVMTDWFTDDKKIRINELVENKTKRIINNKNYHYDDELNLIFVKPYEIENIECDDFLYSMEVENVNNFITTNGILTHNCISVDPYYLIHKAEELDMHLSVIASGRRVNDYMPKHVASTMIKKMISTNVDMNKAKILVMGITFKENVPDLRNSKVIDVVKELETYNIPIDVYDPHADIELLKREYNIDCYNDMQHRGISTYSGIILAVGHDEFKDFYKYDFVEYKRSECVIYDLKGFLPKNEVTMRL